MTGDRVQRHVQMLGSVPRTHWHVLLTRFNLRLNRSDRGRDEVWLRRRLGLFLRYTVPSVVAQAEPPERWIVLCGPSPEWLVSSLTELHDAPFLRVRVCAEPFAPELVASLVDAEVPPDVERVITTRLDNDDAIARSYLAAVRAAAAERQTARSFINFPRGLQLRSGRVYRRWDVANAFASAVEPRDELRTVFLDEHQHLGEHGPVVQVAKPDLWIQIIHSENLANSVAGVRTDPEPVQAGFGADLGLEPLSKPKLLALKCGTLARMGVRTLASPHRTRKALRVAAHRLRARGADRIA